MSPETMPKRSWRLPVEAWIALWVLLIAGCQQEMTDQPRYEPLEPSAFFEDGRSARHLVPGTVARSQDPVETPFSTGLSAGNLVDTLPLPVTRDLLERGRQRYDVYCTPCHDRVGTGQGMIVRRGYPQPPSLHIPRLRQVPIGHLFIVITTGFGARMPAYGWMIPPQDRWAIVAYVRALQFSQYAPVAELPAEIRQQLAP